MIGTAKQATASGFGWAIAVGAATLALAQIPSGGPDVPTFTLREYGINERPSTQMQLLNFMEPVRLELKLTDAQKKREAAIDEQKQQKIQQASRPADTKKLQQAQQRPGTKKYLDVIKPIFREGRAAMLANLTPEQRERLAQIKFQADGPHAFVPPGRVESEIGDEPDLSEQLKMSEDQVRRARAIIQEGEPLIEAATTFAIPMDPNDPLPTPRSLLKLLEGPKFQEARKAARRAGQAARARVIRRIEDEVLSEDQRATYRRKLGAHFDLTCLNLEDIQKRSIANEVGAAMGIGGILDVDLGYEITVTHPAYPFSARHPRVLFDEAHHNWFSAASSYIPLTVLLSKDGYQIIRNRERYTRDVLRKGEILVIPDEVRASRYPRPVEYTDAECDAIRDWVKDGGALLLITDAPPGGGTAENLARRFGVDLSNRETSDPVNSNHGRYKSWLVFSRENHLIGDHPITRGRDDSERLDRVQTFTGQSLKGPEGSVAFLKLADTAVDRASSAVLPAAAANPAAPPAAPVPAASRAQGLAFAFGRGRVVVLGEGTALTANYFSIPQTPTLRYGMNIPGLDNRQMALNIMHWLSGLLESREAAGKKAG